MAILFSDDFNTGEMTGWTTTDLLTINNWGYNSTYCVGCGSVLNFARKTFASPDLGGGAIRAQVACILDSSDPTDGTLIFSAGDYRGGSIDFSSYQLLVYFKPNGAFRIRRKNGTASPTFVDTAPALFPTNGSQFGLQILFVIAATNSVEFVVNNISVATITWSFVNTANQFDDVWIYGARFPFSNPPPALTLLTTVDNYEVDSAAVAVTWPNGTAPTLDPLRTCSGPPLPPTGVTRYIRRIRRFPLPFTQNKVMFLSRLEFLIQSGVGQGTGQARNPVAMVRLSKDGGQTWGAERWLSMGTIGQYAKRAYANNWGRGRNLVCEIVVTDPVFEALIACYADMTEGTS